ncbi:MAG: M28 family peptidase [Planctomycetota bacterium]
MSIKGCLFLTLTSVSLILSLGCSQQSQAGGATLVVSTDSAARQDTFLLTPALSSSTIVAPLSRAIRTPDISATQLLADIKTLCSPRFNGRVFGSPGANDCSDCLAERLDSYGVLRMPASIIRSVVIGPDGNPLKDIRFQEYGDPRSAVGRNVLGWVPSSRSDGAARPYILIVAHYDSTGGSRQPADPTSETIHSGADDNASGVAVALEIARSLSAEPHAMADVGFLFTDGEEAGLIGSKIFASTLSPDRRPALIVNLDMLGRSLVEPPLLPADSTPALACVASDPAWKDAPLIDCVRRVADKRNQPLIFWSSSLMNVWLGGQWVSYTHDGVPFERLGLRVLFFSDGAINAVNSRNDLPDRINLRLLRSRAVFIESFIRAVQ